MTSTLAKATGGMTCSSWPSSIASYDPASLHRERVQVFQSTRWKFLPLTRNPPPTPTMHLTKSSVCPGGRGPSITCHFCHINSIATLEHPNSSVNAKLATKHKFCSVHFDVNDPPSGPQTPRDLCASPKTIRFPTRSCTVPTVPRNPRPRNTAKLDA